MTISEVFKAHNLENILIIDDGYDKPPRANDLTGANDGWTTFFAKLSDDDRKLIVKLRPAYEDTEPEALKVDDAFIELLWKAREDFSKPAAKALFDGYDIGLKADETYLNTLESELAALGLKFETSGRDFHDKALTADLIIMDLFLGAAQRPEDENQSIESLKAIIDERRGKPPAVLLMSRLEGLESRQRAFRTSTKAFRSSFRYIQKELISEPGQLEFELLELGTHIQASRKLSKFVATWQDGIQQAAEQAAEDFRSFDIEDWAQIGDLTLRTEGVTLSNYVLDVFSYALLHAVEGNNNIVSAAFDLDPLISEDFPPNLLGDDSDPLNVVEKTLYQHSDRLAYGSGNATDVAFGDIIAYRADAAYAMDSLFEDNQDLVYVVMTPACDLQREDGATRISLLAGTLKPISRNTVDATAGKPSIPILTLPNGARKKIEWDLTHLETRNHNRITELVSGDAAEGVVVARLRENAALDIQQKMLSQMGRVGLLTPMGETFPFTVRVYYPDADGALQQLAIASEHSPAGICWTGRHGKKRQERMLFDRGWRRQFVSALAALPEGAFNQRSKSKITDIQKPENTRDLFRKGFLADMKNGGQQKVSITRGDADVQLGCAICMDSDAAPEINSNAAKTLGLIFCLEFPRID